MESKDTAYRAWKDMSGNTEPEDDPYERCRGCEQLEQPSCDEQCPAGLGNNWGPLDPASGTDFDPSEEDGYIGRNEYGLLE